MPLLCKEAQGKENKHLSLNDRPSQTDQQLQAYHVRRRLSSVILLPKLAAWHHIDQYLCLHRIAQNAFIYTPTKIVIHAHKNYNTTLFFTKTHQLEVLNIGLSMLCPLPPPGTRVNHSYATAFTRECDVHTMSAGC